MDAERYARIRAWFDALRDLDMATRTARLAEEPDAQVRARVEALLGRDTEGPAAAPKAVSGLLGAIAEEVPKIGDSIGAWTLTRLLGQGGMGTVFEARRSDGHFDQTGALKLLKGLPSATALAFLARERQILAGLAHPNIARLLDGGATPGGHPYFVMAMQEGLPIDQYVADKALRPVEIVRLLLPVCAAIAYAHARLVVHCDLKPANILVDQSGQPCVLDFGIARPVADANATDVTIVESHEARAYTPGFASPELEAGNAVAAATDIYSLGRLLAVLLGDSVLTQHPDLRWIVTRATANDPTLRYRTVTDLDNDLRAWLTHRPVAARPASVIYRGRLWLRRHWAAALVGAVMLVSAIAFTLNTIRERDRAVAAEHTANLERDRALAAETRARQISDFVVSMLDGANPDAGTGEVPVSKLVKEALTRVDTELDGQPEVQAELYGTLGRALRLLGNDQDAATALDKAIALARTIDRPDILAGLLVQLARHRLAAFDAAAAEPPAREAFALYQKLPNVDLETRVDATVLLGDILGNSGNPESTALLEQAVAELRGKAPESSLLSDAIDRLAGNRIGFERQAEAELLLRESLALQKRQGRSDSETSIGTREILGRVLSDLNKVDEAEQMMREALTLRRARLGDDDPTIPWRLAEIGRVLDNHGRSIEAMSYYAESLALAARKIGVDSPSYAVMLNNSALNRQRAGDWSGAEPAFEQAIAIASKRWGESDAGLAGLRANAARFHLDLGKLDRAATLAAAAEAVFASQLPATDGDVIEIRATLARIACAQGQIEPARAWLQKVQSVVPQPKPRQLTLVERAEACIARHAGDLDSALAHLRIAEAADRERFSPDNPQIWLGQLARAELLAARNQPGDRDEARQLARTILAQVDAKLLPSAPQRRRLQVLIDG